MPTTRPAPRPTARLVLTCLFGLSALLAPPILGEDLLVVAGAATATGGFDTFMTTYSFDEGYGAPFVPRGKMPFLPTSNFPDPSDLTVGGFGCQAYASRHGNTVACQGGECSDPLMGYIRGGIFARQSGADDRYVMTAAGTGARQVTVERLDTADGSRKTMVVDLTDASGVPAETSPDIHAIFRNGTNWDLILRTVFEGAEAGHVLRINDSGGIVREYALPAGVVPLAADISGSTVYMQETSGSGFGVVRYRATNYARLNPLVPAGELAPRVLLLVIGDVIVAHRIGTGALGMWNRVTGADMGDIPLPDGATFLTHAAKLHDCPPDNTKVRIGGSNRFELSGTFRDQQGNVMPIRFAPPTSSTAVEAYYTDASNREMLIKTLDACGFTGTHWFFVAAATDLKFDLKVTNRDTGQMEVFRNPAGNPASSINEIFLFSCD